MNRVTILSIGLAAAAAAVPCDTRAITAQAGLEACAEAIVQRMETESGAKPAFRIDSNSTVGTRVPVYGVWHLDVRDPVSEEIMARADCRVNRRAEVSELTTLPLTAADAEIRAR